MNIPRRPTGFSLITVIFILVVLTALGAVIAQLATTQHLGSSLAYEGKQAYYAARAGLEWGRYQLTKANPANCANSSTFTVQGFAVTLTCDETNTFIEDEQSFKTYHLKSTASSNEGVLGTVSRELEMSVWREDDTP